jgi:quercetin dioxygenase-like cupin family protein
LGRNSKLQHFIDATGTAIRARATDHPGMMPMAERVFSCLEYARAKFDAAAIPDSRETDARPAASRLPACRYFNAALEEARSGPAEVAAVAQALQAIEPDLSWIRRAGITPQDGDFYHGHANAILVGQGGLETDDRVTIGISLVAPGIDYPRHRHPPEELYLVLSSGNWMQNDGPFLTRRSGDLVRNAADTWHAMQASDVPLLTVWCLWSDL